MHAYIFICLDDRSFNLFLVWRSTRTWILYFGLNHSVQSLYLVCFRYDDYPPTSSDVLKSLERTMTVHQEIWNLTPLSASLWIEHLEEFKPACSNCLVIVRVLYLWL